MRFVRVGADCQARFLLPCRDHTPRCSIAILAQGSMNRECCTEIAAEFARLKVDVIVGDRCCHCGKEGNVSHAMVRQKESRP